MDSEYLPKGSFTYGPAAAIMLHVEHYAIAETRLLPVLHPSDRLIGRADQLLLSPTAVAELAEAAGVSPLAAAHFTIAYNAGKLAVGRAIPAYNAGLLDRPHLWEDNGGIRSNEELAARRAHRDVFAIEVTELLARRHTDPVDPWELEILRYHMLTATGTRMDGPLQRGVRAKISGDVGLPVAHGIEVIMSWFRQNIGS